MMNEPILILLEFKDGLYPEIRALNTEKKEIKEFLDSTITRANKFKEKTGKYPKDIEDLKGWEEIN